MPEGEEPATNILRVFLRKSAKCLRSESGTKFVAFPARILKAFSCSRAPTRRAAASPHVPQQRSGGGYNAFSPQICACYPESLSPDLFGVDTAFGKDHAPERSGRAREAEGRGHSLAAATPGGPHHAPTVRVDGELVGQAIAHWQADPPGEHCNHVLRRPTNFKLVSPLGFPHSILKLGKRGDGAISQLAIGEIFVIVVICDRMQINQDAGPSGKHTP
jgi:hypothetical protein